MPWYELTKILHYLGLIALFGFFVIYSRAAPRVRAATTINDLRPWLGLLEAAQPMFPGGAAILLVSGLIMTALRWRGPYPFIAVGLVTLVLIGIASAFTARRHLRLIRAGVPANDGPVSDQLSAIILNPRPWAIQLAGNGAALGVLFVMTLKRGWAGSIAIVVIAALIAGVAGSSIVRRERDRRLGTRIKE
jgi:hypothetical protein